MNKQISALGTRASRLLAALVFALCALSPAVARAVEMPQVDIEATVRPDGSLMVEEARTFEFDDNVNGVYWTIPAAQNEQGAPSSVTVLDVEVSEDGQTAQYEPVSSAATGDAGVYTAETSGDGLELKVFTPHDDGETATVTVSPGTTILRATTRSRR